jgi:hypothetical protein
MATMKKRAKGKASRTVRKAAAKKTPAKKPGANTPAVDGALARAFMAELDAELAVTRRCVERMPSEKGQFKPHPSSAAMGHLTQLICKMVGILANIPKGIDLDLKSGLGYSFEATRTLVDEFDRNAKALRASLSAMQPDAWSKTWSVRAGDQVLSTTSRKDAMRNTINHFVHHRGQLTVYLRMNEVPIPQLYGPSGDER